MKKIILTIAILSALSHSWGDWVSMVKTRSQAINYSHTRCFYKGFNGPEVSIVVRGGVYNCPYSIEYNLITNEWR